MHLEESHTGTFTAMPRFSNAAEPDGVVPSAYSVNAETGRLFPSWALIEVKLGGEDDIIQAGKNLINIANDIDREKTGKPAFLMVITKNKVAYQMENGVYAVPLCCLKN